MPVICVQTAFTGAAVRGGGLNQLFFTGTAGADLQEHLDAVAAFWTAVAPQCVGWTAQVQPEVREYDEETGDLTGLGAGTAPSPITSSSTDRMAPPAVQGLIRLRTAGIVGNRLVQGKIFVPGFPANQSEPDGSTSSGIRTAFNAAATALIGDSETELVVWSRPAEDRAGSTWPVLTASAWSQTAVLRSRRD